MEEDMCVSGQAIIGPDRQQDLIDDLDQVFFHLAAGIGEAQVERIAGDLEQGMALSAASTMASIAAARHLAMSQEDRRTLRLVIETCGGDEKHIDLLDSRAAANAPTTTFAPVAADPPTARFAPVQPHSRPDHYQIG